MRATFIALYAFALAGCGPHRETVLGQAPSRETSSVAEATQALHANAVSIEGRIIEKCPIAGCWFIVRDETGMIRVDTKSAGFSVVKVPMGTKVHVSGRVVANGSERMIQATGLNY